MLERRACPLRTSLRAQGLRGIRSWAIKSCFTIYLRYERIVNHAQLPQLHTFLAVARLRSFTAAARELNVSTPAVSQAVRNLEDQLRVALLVRTTRSVSLTDAGRRLVETAGPAV